MPAAILEAEPVRGNDTRLHTTFDVPGAELSDPDGIEAYMRIVTELIALTLQGALSPSALPEHSAPAATVLSGWGIAGRCQKVRIWRGQ